MSVSHCPVWEHQKYVCVNLIVVCARRSGLHFCFSDLDLVFCVTAVSRAVCRAVMRRRPHATWVPTPARTGTLLLLCVCVFVGFISLSLFCLLKIQLTISLYFLGPVFIHVSIISGILLHFSPVTTRGRLFDRALIAQFAAITMFCLTKAKMMFLWYDCLDGQLVLAKVEFPSVVKKFLWWLTFLLLKFFFDKFCICLLVLRVWPQISLSVFCFLCQKKYVFDFPVMPNIWQDVQ